MKANGRRIILRKKTPPAICYRCGRLFSVCQGECRQMPNAESLRKVQEHFAKY